MGEPQELPAQGRPPNNDGGSGRNTEGDRRGQPRSNDTHESTTDPEARLLRKSNGSEAILCYQGHVLIENANGLVVNARASRASGFAERESALAMLAELPGIKARTVGADKGYDTAEFVTAARKIDVTRCGTALTRHSGKSAIDGRTTRHAGYRASSVCEAGRRAVWLGEDRRSRSARRYTVASIG